MKIITQIIIIKKAKTPETFVFQWLRELCFKIIVKVSKYYFFLV